MIHKTGMLGLTLYSCLFLLSVSNAYGQPSYPKDTTVFYGNGVSTTATMAELDRVVLEQRVLRQLGSSDVASLLTFKLAYNRTHKATHGLLDLLEAFIQARQSFSVHFWHWLAGLDSFVDPGFQQIMYPLLAELAEEAALQSNTNVQEHVDKYNTLLLECNRIVVVAHSQGNYYANTAYMGIEPSLASAFGIVSVANPANIVEGGGPYTTLTEDLVIGFIPGSMDANISNNGLFESRVPWHGHAFVKNYLSTNHQAEPRIVSHVIDEIDRVMNVDTIDDWGWPARYGTNIAIFREPSDMAEFAGVLDSQLWDNVVWPAVLRDEIIVEYRLGTSGSWTLLTQSSLRLITGSSWAAYEADRSPNSIAPWFFFNDQYSVGTHDMDSTVEVQPDDVAFGVPKGVQQYRLILDNKVIDQFTVDYHVDPWSTVRTSGPVLDSLPTSSNPIQIIR